MYILLGGTVYVYVTFEFGRIYEEKEIVVHNITGVIFLCLCCMIQYSEKKVLTQLNRHASILLPDYIMRKTIFSLVLDYY